MADALPRLFSPMALAGHTLRNRIAMALPLEFSVTYPGDQAAPEW